MLHSLFALLFSLKTAFCSCRSDVQRNGFQRARSAYKVIQLGRLPKVVTESSGLAYRSTKGTFWTHNDGGGRPTLYEVSRNGALLDSLFILNATNVDWEDLAQKDSNILFVGDFGNNTNTRRDLAVYRIERNRPSIVTRINFRFADQTAFPPPLNQRNYDVEALTYYQNRLYLFSKNRAPRNRYIRQYSLPAEMDSAKADNYAVQPEDSIYIRSMVTGAAVNPDGSTLALLTYGKVLLFAIKDQRINLRHPQRCIRLPRGQTEAITFVSPTDMVVTNERGKVFLLSQK